MNKNTDFKAVVLGGGSAGWLTALYVNKLHPNWRITVIEDPKRPPIIAGESGTTTFVSFLKALGIDNDDFIKQTNATPKLGGRLKNWNGVGTEFYHALVTDHAPWFEDFVHNIEYIPCTELLLGESMKDLIIHREKDLYETACLAYDIPLAEAFYSYHFIKQNKVPLGTSSEIPIAPMWHFESRAAAKYFKDIALSRGISLIEDEYKAVSQSANGDITEILFDQNRSIDGDLFFDCSGFARLLLDKVLHEPIIDYSNFFPARAVVAWWDAPHPCVTTNANAMEYGWSWNINLRHRSGNGYIYDPDHISLDQAVAEAEKFYGYKINPIANFSFTPGMMRNSWKNNVIGIGLSAGFLEPLEANGIQVIIESLWAFEDLFRAGQKDDIVRKQRFNDRVFALTDDVLDFLALHYRGHRRDTEFWKSHAYDKFRIPDSLTAKLDQWEHYFNGDLGAKARAGGYSSTAWLQVLQGLTIFDTEKLKKQYLFLKGPVEKTLQENSNKYNQLVSRFPSVEEWLNMHK
jgi:tryptophan halogenase